MRHSYIVHMDYTDKFYESKGLHGWHLGYEPHWLTKPLMTSKRDAVERFKKIRKSFDDSLYTLTLHVNKGYGYFKIM